LHEEEEEEEKEGGCPDPERLHARRVERALGSSAYPLPF
tara:strand:- start:1252 stop:1368 length:117 start_codon:yes stop_codon:yes gene_type:complete